LTQAGFLILAKGIPASRPAQPASTQENMALARQGHAVLHRSYTSNSGGFMLRYLLSASFLFASAACVCGAQTSSGSSQGSQAQPTATAPAPTTPAAAKPATTKDQPANKVSANAKKKPKKVWTDDDISKVSGGISVVGDSSPGSDSKTTAEPSAENSENSAQNSDIQNYREQIRQLEAQLDVTDKKLDELRNFKGDNASASGGIDPNHGYTMTPVADQIQQLEDKKKQIQDQIDSVLDEARKKGIEPGQLR
jgi:flagellar motility protein MotE (MotC chaperone)